MERKDEPTSTDGILKKWPNMREMPEEKAKAFGSELGAQHQLITFLCQRAREAAQLLATLPPARLDEMLEEIAHQLELAAPSIFAANALDIEAAEKAGLTKAMVDRLRITEKSLAAMVAGVRQVRALPQPLGEVIRSWTRPNGIRISKVRVPIGVIAIIYESRPNVTIDAAVLCLKTGNATVLRGGKEAIHSNRALISALDKCTLLPKGAVQLITDTDRALVPYLCRQSEYIDVIIPRGGKSLIETVVSVSNIPVIKHADGICAAFVHAEADFAMAEKIILNAKVQRPSACNAIETLLIDKEIAQAFVPRIAAALVKAGVEIHGDEIVVDLADVPGVKPASAEIWATEHLDLVLAVKVVDGLDGALEHLAHFSSNHSDTIITENEKIAERFLNEVDSATVYWNASTRFTDGGEFGFGAEIGISTDKLHARGPMGLEELTSYKYLIRGTGQVRG
jgi:glutamate-5-semialdehyde dehydrogenase